MLGVEPAAAGVQQQLGLHADVDLHGLPGGLHPARRVDRVPEQAVARHLAAHHARHHGPRVDTNPANNQRRILSSLVFGPWLDLNSRLT